MVDAIPIELRPSSPEVALPPSNPASKILRTARGPVYELTDSSDDEPILVSIKRAPAQKAYSDATTGSSTSCSGARELLQSSARVGQSRAIETVAIQHSKNIGHVSLDLVVIPRDETNQLIQMQSPTPTTSGQASGSGGSIIDLPQKDTESPPLFPPPPSPPIAVEPEPKPDPVAHILEIIPDVQPEHVLDLIRQHSSPEREGAALVQHVLHILFDDPTYPKVDRKGKGKRKETSLDEKENADGTPSKKVKIDYTTKSRPFTGGVHYFDLALEQLQLDFPFTPKPYLRSLLGTHGKLYAPTYLFLKQVERDHKENGTALPYTRKSTPYRLPTNAKAKKRELQDAELDAERAWLISSNITDETIRTQNEEDEIDGIECGCCFTVYPFTKMVQCPETHLFCIDCMTTYAETLLGSHDPNIKCMDQSGCKAEIPASELRRFLPTKLIELWERVKQRKEVEAAGIEGLEECPFCEWSCVIENPDEKLFRCENVETCGEVSCRSCKKPDHLPKGCKEADEEKHLDGQHAVEEAMTRALMRNCPKCKKPFIKEAGCNKMTCPNCMTLSCYICRQIINGYDHFNQQLRGQPGPSNSPDKEKCLLWDSVEERHVEEVKQAAAVALAEFKRENPDAEENAIKVDIPIAPTPKPNHNFNRLNDAALQAQNALNEVLQEALRLQREENDHLGRMQQYEAEVRLVTQQNLPYHNRDQALELEQLNGLVQRTRDQWYQARQRTEHARQRERQARANVEAMQPQRLGVPPMPMHHQNEYDLNVNNQWEPALQIRAPGRRRRR